MITPNQLVSRKLQFITLMKLLKFISRALAVVCVCILFSWLNLSCHHAVLPITDRLPVKRGVLSKDQSIDPPTLQRAFDQKDLVDAVRQVERGWQLQYETYYEGKLKTQYLELPEIQRRLANIDKLTQTHSALLYAIPQPDKLYLILVPAQGEPVYQSVDAANAQALAELTKEFRLNLVNIQTTPEDYLPPAQKLYSWVIQPVLPQLRSGQIDTIIFCLGGGLRSLPLAALHDGQQFLVEQYNLALIPAFNLLDHRPAVLTGLQVLATGASEFQDNQPLAAVPLELETITQRSSWPGLVLLNQSFTLAKFLEARSQTPYGIIHLATHADISAKSVRDSYIQFWDRRLQLDQLHELQLATPVVQLLVLSACRTALGTPNAALGFAGLAVQSGAKAVLASLWSVDDMGTLVLMSEFYQQLKKASVKSAALRQTQIAMLQGNLKLESSSVNRASRNGLPQALQPLKNEDLSHPYYWAAFAMVGNPW
jgi:CHAT domain-containing protein